MKPSRKPEVLGSPCTERSREGGSSGGRVRLALVQVCALAARWRARTNSANA